MAKKYVVHAEGTEELQITFTLAPEDVCDLYSILGAQPVVGNCTLIKCLKSDLDRIMVELKDQTMVFAPYHRTHQFNSVL